MTRARGSTLIELMITVAILAIGATVATSALVYSRRQGEEALVRESASALLDDAARALSVGGRFEEVEARARSLPEGRLWITRSGDLVTARVSYRLSGRDEVRERVLVGRR